MTDLDELPFAYPDTADANLGAAPRRTCRHPRPYRRPLEDGGWACGRCGTDIDPARARRGKSARRLGGDQERRIERVYGPTKIGERGDPVDHLGRLFKWQSKASRRSVPSLLSAIRRMDGLYGDRLPVLVLSFVRAGVPVEDFVVMRGRDFLDLHGRDEEGSDAT